MEHDAASSSSVHRLVLVVATMLVLTHSWPVARAVSAESQCDPPGVWQTGEALDETASRASGANVSLIEPTRSGKLQECVDRCCKRDDCSVATVKVQDKGTVLCALFNCNPPEKCIFKKSARLLSLDRTATAFLRRVVAGWPKYSNIEVHTGNISSTNATPISSSTSPTPDTTLPVVAEATTANVTMAASGDKSTTTSTSAPKLNTEDSDANSPMVTTDDVTTASGLNASTSTSTTHQPLGLGSILDLLNHVAESRTHSELHEEATSSTDSANHVSSTSLSPSGTASTTESFYRSSSTTPADDDMSPPPFSDMPEVSSSTEGTTSTTTTVSSALEASMKKILPTKMFDGDSWWSPLSAPVKASNPSTNASSVPTQSPNATEKATDAVKSGDIRGPIQIFAPTTLNVDLMPKASPSISLVIGLCLGLLLIFVVMGLIGRRILDVWQRRHYSKMDFLVDGMYHVT
ncbi:uncharacterized protein [Dermacentor andersoni]|uniref:uncharacterized protein n=1 Tax=Dermacentor andersoni TaxID=34620 RepID=UPI003B3A99FF